VWQDFEVGQFSVPVACRASMDASLIAAAKQTAAEIVGAARRRAGLLDEQTRVAQESVAAARQEAEQIVADARAVADASLEQAATMIRDAREKAARLINDARTDVEKILKAARDRHGQPLAAGGGGAGVIMQRFQSADGDGHSRATADRDYACLDTGSVAGISAAGNCPTALTSWLLRPREEADFIYLTGHLSTASPADPRQLLKTSHHGADTSIQGLSRRGQWQRKMLQILLVVEGPIDEIPGRRWLTGYPYSPPRLVVLDSCAAQVDTAADLIYALDDQVHACQIKLWKCLRHRLGRAVTTPVTCWQVEGRAAPDPTAGDVMIPFASLTTLAQATTLHQAVEQILQVGANALLVRDEDQMVGVVTLADLARTQRSSRALSIERAQMLICAAATVGMTAPLSAVRAVMAREPAGLVAVTGPRGMTVGYITARSLLAGAQDGMDTSRPEQYGRFVPLLRAGNATAEVCAPV